MLASKVKVLSPNGVPVEWQMTPGGNKVKISLDKCRKTRDNLDGTGWRVNIVTSRSRNWPVARQQQRRELKIVS